MTNKEKKAALDKAFKNGDNIASFQLLFELPAYEIYSVLSKKSVFKDKQVLKELFGTFTIQEHTRVFTPYVEEFILNHYLKFSAPNSVFEEFLVVNYPEQFINAIRTDRSFIDINNFERLSSLNWPSDHSSHLHVWKEIRAMEQDLWDKVEQEYRAFSELPIEIKLVELTLWIESELFNDPSSENNEHLCHCYDLIITSVLCSIDQKKDLDLQLMISSLHDRLKNEKIEDRDYFEAVSEWISFRDGLFASYSFDLNFQPVLKDGKIDLQIGSEENYTKWQLDGARYRLNELRYKLLSDDCVEHEISEGKTSIPEGGPEIDRSINEEVFRRSWKGMLYLNDLYLSTLKYGKSKVHLSKPINLLTGYSWNRFDRYNKPLQLLKAQGASFFESCLTLMSHWFRKSIQENRTYNIPSPYYYESFDDTALTFKSFEEFKMDQDESKSLVEIFSYLIPQKEFDRWNIYYDVQKTPFVKIGRYLFCPLSFVTFNEWFYSLGQRALDIINRIPKKKYSNQRTWEECERKRTSDEMEKGLAEQFSNRGWTAKVITDEESSSLDGDIDLFIQDNDTQLFIQLKRTVFKLDLEDALKERFETDLKAAGQINEMIKSAAEYPTNLKFEILPDARRWVVSTSYEGTLHMIDGCRKINYFDLIWALENSNLHFETLNELIQYMERDGPFKDGEILLTLL